MSVKSLLLVLPLSFVLLLVHTPFAASLLCYIPYADHRLGYFIKAGKHLAQPVAADCLHIASVLPSSLTPFDPTIQPSYERLTLSYGPLSNHHFDLPAAIRHKSCEVSLFRSRLDHRTQVPQPWRDFTREETAFYLWNALKAELQAIIQLCIAKGTGAISGSGSVHGSETGLPGRMEDWQAIINVYPTGAMWLADDTHIYYV